MTLKLKQNNLQQIVLKSYESKIRDWLKKFSFTNEII